MIRWYLLSLAITLRAFSRRCSNFSAWGGNRLLVRLRHLRRLDEVVRDLTGMVVVQAVQQIVLLRQVSRSRHLIAIFTVNLISVKLFKFVVILGVIVHTERLMHGCIQVYLVHVNLVIVTFWSCVAFIIEVWCSYEKPISLLVIRLWDSCRSFGAVPIILTEWLAIIFGYLIVKSLLVLLDRDVNDGAMRRLYQ